MVLMEEEGAYGRSSSRLERSDAQEEREGLSGMAKRKQEGRSGSSVSMEFRFVGSGLGFW